MRFAKATSPDLGPASNALDVSGVPIGARDGAMFREVECRRPDLVLGSPVWGISAAPRLHHFCRRRERSEPIAGPQPAKSNAPLAMSAVPERSTSNEGSGAAPASPSLEQEIRFRAETIPSLLWSTVSEGSIEYVNKRALIPLNLVLRPPIRGIGSGDDAVHFQGRERPRDCCNFCRLGKRRRPGPHAKLSPMRRGSGV